ncbi:hypothetical protein O6H91_11G082100 [Diphasiastrum complanatum]|uniref:Uncharacterized protein n=2 Tax=Diphasiastrum complanatum TaxID=34168 RepID=A0ACC2CB28_DIPCM|nr:hypothetical protein O6H91_11G082100 [Diphasiastrum complanatum]KAJ7539234.1 hypothetical protein O6H91_11G082100 [Diphasiastrum complanatum]
MSGSSVPTGGARAQRSVKQGSGSSPRAAAGMITRRSSSGRYVHFLSQDDIPVEMLGETLNLNYTVHMPPTPDNQPMSGTQEINKPPAMAMAAAQSEQHQRASNVGLFSSGTFNHRNKTEGPLPPIARGSRCSIPGCDEKAMTDTRGEDISPCECSMKICKDCYVEALNTRGACPACKEPYKADDVETQTESSLPLTSDAPQDPALDRRLSIMKPTKPAVLRGNQSSEFDHSGWLFETKGTYGYGNAVWPKDDPYLQANGGEKNGGPPDFDDKSKQPLCRQASVSAAILSPYRLLVVIRFVVLVFFLWWRVSHPNKDAKWLWGMSVVCEIWFAFSWILDQLPKLCPVIRITDLEVLKEKFEQPGPNNPKGRSDLPAFDVFVSTADPEKEPPLVTANTILSILAAEYPVEKVACYLSDDGGAILTFEALAEAASFAQMWVPFCRKHEIEPRNPETYFAQRGDPTRNKVRSDFVKERRRMKREFDEFKVRINGLPDAIRRRSDAYNAHEELKAKRQQLESGADLSEPLNVPKATWMSDGTQWPGTWSSPARDHARGDHAGVLQVMLTPPDHEPQLGEKDENMFDFIGVDVRLPMLVYVSREKRPGYDHNKKAGAMNALVRTSAVMSNGPFILNLDCDHYIYNSLALREAMCFMMDPNGDDICYVQFPQRFEGIDPNDRYANNNTVFFDINMRALDGVQGPFYVGTGCVFRRTSIYGFDPPRYKSRGCCGGRRKAKQINPKSVADDSSVSDGGAEDELLESQLLPKSFGTSGALAASIPVAEFQGRPLADSDRIKHGRPPGALIAPREPLDASTVLEAISVISCFYEDRTEWGNRVGWIYGSVTEDVVTGFRMHNRGWRSIYCFTKMDAFRGTAPINLTDRLHQVLRWATGSVEIFFSRNNALLASCRLKFLQRIAYLNVGIYPFTSIFLLVYCFLPALSLFTGQFIVESLNLTFLVYLLIITVTLCLLAILEVKWSGITLEEWWRNEQFWLIGGTSAHLAAVLQGLLKVVAGVDISFTLTSKSGGDDEDDSYADLYIVKWSSLMIPPITIMMINLIAIAVGVSRTIYSDNQKWSQLLGGVFFSFWVLVHLYPFAKGLMGRRGRTPTVVFVWAGLLSIIISLLWVAISPPKSASAIGGSFQFP